MGADHRCIPSLNLGREPRKRESGERRESVTREVVCLKSPREAGKLSSSADALE